MLFLVVATATDAAADVVVSVCAASVSAAQHQLEFLLMLFALVVRVYSF